MVFLRFVLAIALFQTLDVVGATFVGNCSAGYESIFPRCLKNCPKDWVNSFDGKCTKLNYTKKKYETKSICEKAHGAGSCTPFQDKWIKKKCNKGFSVAFIDRCKGDDLLPGECAEYGLEDIENDVSECRRSEE